MFNPPDSRRLRHSNALENKIKAMIKHNGGWISFEKYMETALYDRDYGYYGSGTAKFGESGDFITAPEIGNLFARCLAKQCVEIFENLGAEGGGGGKQRDDVRNVIEFGAGTGQLAADVLKYFEDGQQALHEYAIIETSGDLIGRQKQTIQNLCPQGAERVRWLSSFPDSGFSGVIIANELLDALPVARFEIGDDGRANVLGVGCESGFRFAPSSMKLGPSHQRRLAEFQLPRGYRSEIGIQAEAWLRTVCENVNTGVVMLIDYGFPRREYYHPDRKQGTLMCHYLHAAHHDVFLHPGLQDITSHVDFSAMADVAVGCGMSVEGYCPQASFLLSLGLLDAVDENAAAFPTRESISISQEIKKLTLPHEMGEIFKVLVLSRDYSGPIAGFGMQNHAGRL